MIKKLTDREHVILRPAMYIGAVDQTKSYEYIYDEGSIAYAPIEYVPGLIKIINEVIDNAVDVAIKSNFKYANEISVKMTEEWVEVRDNGTGIPVEQASFHQVFLASGQVFDTNKKWVKQGKQFIEKDGEIIWGNENLGKGFFRIEKHWQPELCWGHGKSGDNFDDDENRTQMGMNGVGSFASNCFSTKFTGKSDDGNKSYTVTFKDNASAFKEEVKKSKATPGVNVKFWPDLEKFGVEEIDDVHMSMIKQRLINLCMSFPEITFKFNGKKINVNSFKKYISLFSDSFEFYETEDYKFAVLPNEDDDFRQFSYVNGLKIPDGGTHIDILSYQIVSRIRDKLAKKFKTIKPGDIKNKLMIVAFLKDVKNAKFNSQSKEKITNGAAEINQYFGEIPYDDIVKKILRNKNIIDPITEVYRIKEEFKKRQELKGLKKNVKQIKDDKYLPSIGVKKFLVLVEGDSALGGLMPVLGRKECGYFTLRGIPLNAYAAPQAKFTKNKELSALYKVIQNEGYEYIIYGTDQDLDGYHIRGLLNGFFVRYLSDWLDKIGILQTPVISIKKNKKLVKWYYNLSDQVKLKSGEVSKYMKGLGSWKTPDLKAIIEKDGLENMIDFLEFDDIEIVDDWLSHKKADKRKEYILNNDFNIAKI